jgi:hypothetical protein
MSGVVTLSSSGSMMIEGKSDRCAWCFCLYKPLMVMLVTDNRRVITIWRDACQDSSYRRLMVVLDSIVQKRE